jgi:SAM-dependent methyltransferase
MGLTRDQAKRFYDRMGRGQDLQAFYEDRAINELISHASLESARSVFELGCGTGRLAERLLDHHLPPDAKYVGIEISQTMAALSRTRLQRFGGRAHVLLVDGSGPLPGGKGTFDRFVSTYVFDLLSPEDSAVMLDEARRLLGPDGLLCLVSLAAGATRATRLVSSVWTVLWSRIPVAVGGCRPIDLRQLLRGWHIEHRGLISAWGLTSEVVIAST